MEGFEDALGRTPRAKCPVFPTENRAYFRRGATDFLAIQREGKPVCGSSLACGHHPRRPRRDPVAQYSDFAHRVFCPAESGSLLRSVKLPLERLRVSIYFE